MLPLLLNMYFLRGQTAKKEILGYKIVLGDTLYRETEVVCFRILLYKRWDLGWEHLIGDPREPDT